MEVKDYVVAIDLGTTNVVTLVGCRNDNDELEVVASSIHESQGIIRGDIKNIELISKSLKDTLDTIENELNISISEAYVGISGQHIKCSKHSGYIFIENNDGEVKEIDVHRLNASMRNIQVPIGETIIHILPQNYLVDGDAEMKEPVGVIGKKLEAMFNIVTNDKAAVGRTEKCLSRVNLRSTQYILNALASAEAVLHDDEKELGVAVIDIGGGTTDIAIFHDNIIRHVGVVPMGGSAINKDIRSVGILERHVENLKIKYGSAVAELAPNKIVAVPGLDSRAPKEISLFNLSGIIEARLMDIIDCVKVELKRSGFEKMLEGGLVLTGGCSQLENIDLLFKKHTGYHVRVADRVVRVKTKESDIINNPIYATAVGVLLKGTAAGASSKTDVHRLNNTAPKPMQNSFVPPTSTPTPSFSRNETYSKPEHVFQPKMKENHEQEPEQEYDEDEYDNQDKPKKIGFITRWKTKINDMFEVVDDDKIDDERI